MLNYEYPPLGGGASPITGAMAHALADQGHEVDVVTMSFKGQPPVEQCGGLRVFRVPSWRRSQVSCSTPEMLTYLPPAFVKAIRLHRSRPYDLIHAHFIIPTSPVAVALRALTGLPVVVTIHGSDVPGYNPDRFKLGHSLLAPVWRMLTRRADAIVSPSAYLRNLLQSQSAVPVAVIPYGFEPAPTANVERKQRILAASRLFRRKGIHDLLEALNGLALEGWDIVVAGDGPELQPLREQATRLGLHVQFPGFLKGQRLLDLYAGSEIFVFPSHRDNFPVALLEAMAAGCAVIASDTSGMPEVVGPAGLLVPPGSPQELRAALIRLMGDPALRNRLGEAARNRIDELRWPAIISRYEELYRSVMRPQR